MVERTIYKPDAGEFTIDGAVPGRRCENCRFWGRLEGGGTCCRRKPPIALPVMGPAGLNALIGLYPPSRAHDWCGEWDPKAGVPDRLA